MNISLIGLSKSYLLTNEKLRVLDDINYEFASGTTTSIVGPSGSGKTTLLSLIAGLDNPDQGKIMIGSDSFGDMNEADRTKFRSRNMGIVFQRFHLIPTLTAIENVALPLEINKMSGAFEQAASTLTAVGLGTRLEHLPAELSGGECQRVAIARAMIHQPRIILADEPSGNLDTETGDHVMNLLFDLCSKNKTSLILVTHNERHAERCQRVLRIAGGKIKL